MRTLQHPTLGEVEVIVEVMHKEKHFYLIRQNMVVITEGKWYRRRRTEMPARPWDKRPVFQHYCMWGNTNDPNEMGTTKILTKNCNKPRINTINKYFFEMVNQSENLTFKK